MDKGDVLITDHLTKSQIRELVHHATSDPVLHKFTSDQVRFKDEEAVKRWLGTSPSLSVLTNTSGTLLGLAWVQDSEFPGEIISHLTSEVKNTIHTTSGIRLYGEARGKGLGVWFFKSALNRYGSVNFWSRVSADNVASIRIQQKIGFLQVSQPDIHNKIILVRYATID